MKYHPNDPATWPKRYGGDEHDPIEYAAHLRESNLRNEDFINPRLRRSQHTHDRLWLAIAVLYVLTLPLAVVAMRVLS